MIRFLLPGILLMLSTTVSARMYQWLDTETGTTQLSGKPPAWYRGSDIGPRVFVFDNGRIIDDTDIRVSDSERLRLRQQALLKAEEEREAARENLLRAERMKAAQDQRELAAQESAAEMPSLEEDAQEPVADTERSLPDTQGLTAQDMRNLITEWEQRRADSAREIITPQ